MKIKKSKIMLVEESRNLRRVLKEYFVMMDFVVKDFGDGKSAIRSYRQDCCDICLIDIDLPKEEGYVILRELHGVTPDLPVVLLSANESKEEKMKGFEAGCEDFITKPFSTDELLLRIETVLKRCEKKQKKSSRLNIENIFKIGDFNFSYNNMTLMNGEYVRMLTRKEAKLLKLLCQHENKPVPREILFKEVWGDTNVVLGRSLDVFISKIRHYLTSDEKIEIVAIHGTGYLLKTRRA